MLLPFQQRVVEELAELNGRLGRLRVFIGSAAFEALDQPDRLDLMEQLYHMHMLSQILARRIARFEES